MPAQSSYQWVDKSRGPCQLCGEHLRGVVALRRLDRLVAHGGERRRYLSRANQRDDQPCLIYRHVISSGGARTRQSHVLPPAAPQDNGAVLTKRGSDNTREGSVAAQFSKNPPPEQRRDTARHGVGVRTPPPPTPAARLRLQGAQSEVVRAI